MKNISVLGSTGSIGTQSLEVARRYPSRFRIVALTGNNNVDLLAQQAAEFKPKFVATASKTHYAELVSALKARHVTCEVAAGEDAMLQAASYARADTVLLSVVGMCGLKLLLRAIDSGKNIALANKESLVAGGALVMPRVKEKGVALLPVDSEHSAVWQCLHSGRKADVKRIVLTASGGPFYGKTVKDLYDVTPTQAIRHPNWNMGAKISVDSATMMNKGLELIEARWLFDTLAVDYVIHRQSIVHSMVEFIDGAVIAQLSNPNMELPIQLALSYPSRLKTVTPSWPMVGSLDFSPPDEQVFPLPSVAKEAMHKGGILPCALNAANEAAVALFLGGKIRFTQIGELIAQTLDTQPNIPNPTLNDLTQNFDDIQGKLMRDYNGTTERVW